jgi:predicted secreted protein
MPRPILHGALAVLLGASASGLSVPVVAQSAPTSPQGTKLVLNQTATREVEQDALVAVLTARAGAASVREAQAAVNAAMAAAIDRAAAAEDVRRATGGYRVYQERDRNGQPRGWVAEQDLRLTSRDAGPLLELVGTLQANGLVMSGLAYTLSADARKAIENELTIEALAALRTRADRVAEAMAMRVEAIELLRLGGIGDESPVRPMMQARAADVAAVPPPVALPDVETVRLGVDAEIRLSPR